MADDRLPQSRSERLIAFGRFVLAVSSLGAVYLDPIELAHYATFTYTILAIYAAYSLAVVLWSSIGSGYSRRSLVISHTFDLLFFGTINYVTFGPTSPFFVFFVFSIICAMLRFGRRGTIATATTAIVVFIASSIVRPQEADLELNRFIIRLTYLFVVGSMLIYFTEYQERIRRDLERIARWPRSPRRDHESLISNLMSEAGAIFGASRVILAYQHLSRRVAYQGTTGQGELRVEELPPETAAALLQHQKGTYFSSASFPAARVDLDDSTTAQPRTVATAEELHKMLGIEAVVATSFKGELVRGRLLLIEGAPPLLEEINLARIAGTVVAGRLDHHYAAHQLQRGAVAEARVRVARDLHDSVLQSLTGVALQLRTLPKLVTRDRVAAEERLREIEQVITSTQKELRRFIDELRPEGRTRDDGALADRFVSLAKRFRDQWGLDVRSFVAEEVHGLPTPLRREIDAIVSEAVANVAKHAQASRVGVSVDVENGAVSIEVADDGKGFPFQGRFDLASLLERQMGPITLKERVSAAGGEMVIDSSRAGAKLEIRMPVSWEEPS